MDIYERPDYLFDNEDEPKLHDHLDWSGDVTYFGEMMPGEDIEDDDVADEVDEDTNDEVEGDDEADVHVHEDGEEHDHDHSDDEEDDDEEL